jgi:hypothetical protein
MHALHDYGALFCAAISGGNVVRGHAVAEHLSGTRVRVRRQVRAGLREGGEHRLMRMVGGSGSNGLFVYSGLEGKSGAAGGCSMMSVLRSAAMRMSYTYSVHRISDFVRIVYERHLTCGPLI